MMGILDALVKNPQMIGDAAKFASENPQIAKAAMQMFSSNSGADGGLGGLLDKLESGGLGDAVASWVGSGENKAVDPARLGQALGPARLSQFAEKAGVSASEASTLLAGMMPGLVDKLSPDGKLPDKDGLDELIGGLLGNLSRKYG
jgi:uncharacterized protein YidB (DUF937 family)